MANLNIRLTDQTHQLWALHCKANGDRPSTAARSLVEEALQSSYTAPTVTVHRMRCDEKKQRVDVLLTLSELEAISKITGTLGGRRSAWIVDAVRTALTNHPSFTESEIKSLNESTYALNNHNKLLREWINTVKGITISPNDEMLGNMQASVDAMAAMVTKHCEKVADMVDAASTRWGIKSK